MCESVDIPHVDHVPRRPSALQVHRTLGFERAGVEGRGAEMREDSVVSGNGRACPRRLLAGTHSPHGSSTRAPLSLPGPRPGRPPT